MTEQLRPVDGRQNAVDLRPHPGPSVRTADLELCREVADVIRGALDEYLHAHPISARLHLRQAARLITTHLEGGVS